MPTKQSDEEVSQETPLCVFGALQILAKCFDVISSVEPSDHSPALALVCIRSPHMMYASLHLSTVIYAGPICEASKALVCWSYLTTGTCREQIPSKFLTFIFQSWWFYWNRSVLEESECLEIVVTFWQCGSVWSSSPQLRSSEEGLQLSSFQLRDLMLRLLFVMQGLCRVQSVSSLFLLSRSCSRWDFKTENTRRKTNLFSTSLLAVCLLFIWCKRFTFSFG